ncbi:MAG TPA: 16S rRNA (guanine(966)-N(2))-methyltransferase RsmD [Candidatus Omnitrophota bacterium]|nr:16S rRNA (guanine(966)-N(2))-methyltransferase RsmD [Candidatus Omnitrophota bacterium]
MMRIIGGEFRSRKIESPSSGAARPTKDRVRESVFNIISPRIAGSRALDLFAGSGAYGLEALSRGAASCVFVENNPECAGVISRNIEKLKVRERASIEVLDVYRYLEEIGKRGEKFDIVFSDAPYGLGMSRNVLIMAERYDILSPFGILIIEHDGKEDVPEQVGDVSVYKQKSYGITSISVFLKK